MKSQVSEHGLDGVEIFRDLEDAERARLAAELETLNLKRGDVLVRQGETADALYVVVTGRFLVTVAGRREPVAELGPGQPVGEIAFLAGGVRTATVTALRDSLVLRLGRAEFEELSAKSPSIWHTLTVTLARRVAEGNITPRAAARPAPAHRHAHPRRRAASCRRASSSAWRACSGTATAPCWCGRRWRRTVLPRQRAHRQHRGDARAQRARGRLRLRAVRGRARADALVGEGDPPGRPGARRRPAWGRRAAQCAGAAGRRAAAARCAAPRSAARDARAHHPARRAGWRPATIAMHHHVALDNVGDAERLYRFINGTALGLVACGGGAYCAAHVGLYKALVQSGLTFDIMGGTSGGARHDGAPSPWASQPDDDRPRHARHVRHQPGHAPLHLAALQPDRPHQLRSPARQVLLRRRHRGSVDPLLLRLHQPVELRFASPPPGRPVGCRACQRLHPRAAAAHLHQGRPHAGRRRHPRQRADPRDARAEKRAQRGDQLRGAQAAALRGGLPLAAGPHCAAEGDAQSVPARSAAARAQRRHRADALA